MKKSKYDNNSFILKSNLKHDFKFDYSKVNYKGSKTKVKIICPIHGEFEQVASEHLRGNGCKLCRNEELSKSRLNDINDFIIKANEIHNNLYDYTNTIYTNSRSKVKILCPIHGEFEQRASAHLNGQGCNECGKLKLGQFKKWNNDIFIYKSNEIHNNKYDYSKAKYLNFKTKVKIICPIHGEFEQTPQNHIRGNGCKLCGFNLISETNKMSNEEFILKCKEIHNNKYDYSITNYKHSLLEIDLICNTCKSKFSIIASRHLNNKLGCPKCSCSEFEKSVHLNCLNSKQKDRNVIYPLELDIYIPDKNIAIECNGNYWHSELQGKDKNYHLTKTIECEKKGIQLLHIFESEWIEKEEIWKSLINSKLELCKRLYARKCDIKEISTKEKDEFLNRTHLQGEDKSKVRIGLYHNNELVSVMTFCKSRFNKNYEWELSRFSSELNTTIVGGASKLLNYFIKNYNPNNIITYADRRHSNGNLYKQLGFTFSHYSKPNYFYIQNSNYLKLVSRQQFQKHKLKNKLELFNSDLSEWENMKLNGYDRIWDCGNSVWIK